MTRCPSSTPPELAVGLGQKKLTLRPCRADSPPKPGFPGAECPCGTPPLARENWLRRSEYTTGWRVCQAGPPRQTWYAVSRPTGSGSGLAPLQVQRQQPLQDLLVAQVVRPAVGVEDRLVQLPVGQVQPGRALVVEVGQGALLQLGLARPLRVEPARRASPPARGRPRRWPRPAGSSAGSWPGGQGKGKVSKVVVGV